MACPSSTSGIWHLVVNSDQYEDVIELLFLAYYSSESFSISCM